MTSNYEREDLFARIVNKNTDDVNRQIAMQKKLNADFDMVERAIEQSIRCEDVRQEVARKAELSYEEKRKFMKKMGIILSSAAVVVAIGLGIAYPHIVETQEINQATSIAVNQEISKARKTLLSKGLAELDYGTAKYSLTEVPFQVHDNTVAGYSKLGVSSDDLSSIYAYKRTLSEKEFDDFMHAVAGVSFDEYLKQNNFKNESDFDKQARDESYNEYKVSRGK